MIRNRKGLPSAKRVETQEVENQPALQALFQALATSQDTEEVEAIQAQIAAFLAKRETRTR